MKRERLRILFGIRTLENPGGGAERVLAVITERLVSRGHQVGVLTFDDPPVRPFYPFDPRVVLIGIGIGDPSRSARMTESVRRIGPLRAAAKSFRPDVAVGFMHSMFVPLGLALFGSRVPVVASEHIPSDDYQQKPWWHRAMLGLTPCISRCGTVPSEAVRESFGRRIAARQVVIPNPVVRGPAAPVASQRSETIIAVGRLFPQKDHRTLIAAFADIVNRYPEWQLEILGDGELRAALTAQASDAGVGTRVHFRGNVEDVDEHLRRAAILAVPSRYESFGLATAEGLAEGVPAVGFADCLGTNELIIDGVNGLLVAGGPDDAQRVANLADGLERLMRDPHLRAELGAAGPATLERFNPDRVTDRWDELLRDIVRD